MAIAMQRLTVIILLSTASGIVNAGRELVDLAALFEPCAFGDPKLDTCLTNNLQILFREWKHGARGSNALLLLDPLAIKRVRIRHKAGFTAVLTKMLVCGASKAVVEGATMNKQRLVVNATITVPKLIFETDYSVEGNIIKEYVRDSGNSSFEAENVKTSLLIGLKVRLEGELTAITVDNFRATVEEMGDFRLHFVIGENKLDEGTNFILRNHWRLLYEIIHPFVEKTLQKALEDRFKKIFAALPANSFIQNMPISKSIFD